MKSFWLFALVLVLPLTVSATLTPPTPTEVKQALKQSTLDELKAIGEENNLMVLTILDGMMTAINISTVENCIEVAKNSIDCDVTVQMDNEINTDVINFIKKGKLWTINITDSDAR